MPTDTNLTQNFRFKIGWIILLGFASLMSVGHFGMIFFQGGDETTLFVGLTVFNIYAFLVVYVPFRRGERWAWVATWLLPIGLALLAFFVPAIAIYYYAIAAVCVLGLLLTMRDFFSKR